MSDKDKNRVVTNDSFEGISKMKPSGGAVKSSVEGVSKMRPINNDKKNTDKK